MEIATPLAHDHRSLHARCPDDRPVQDLAEMVEQRVTAVLGRLDDARVLLPGKASGAFGSPPGPYLSRSCEYDLVIGRTRSVLLWEECFSE